MLRIIIVFSIFCLLAVAASGCHISTSRDHLDKGDASVVDDSENDGDRSTESKKESKSASDDSDDSSFDISSQSKDKENAYSSGSGGIYDKFPSLPENGGSTAGEETGGAIIYNPMAGTGGIWEDNNAGAADEPSFEGEVQPLSCDDDECANIFPFGDTCCTTGDDYYSDDKGLCGTDMSNLPMLPSSESVPAACFQLDRPGEIDSACPEQVAIFPFFGGPGCCTKSGYCGGWSDDSTFPLPMHFGCMVNATADEPPEPCRLFETPEECRDVYKERGELTMIQGCVCDYCLSALKSCRLNLGCVGIWECMLESGCRDVEDCYFSTSSPCKEEFEQYDSASLSYALRVSNCVQSNCD